MSVRITDNTARLKFDVQAKTNLFMRFFMDDVERFSDPITPKKEGFLRRSTLKTVSGAGLAIRGVMKWQKVYASAQEAGIIRGHPILNYTTPGTGPHYAQRGVEKALANASITMRKAGL